MPQAASTRSAGWRQALLPKDFLAERIASFYARSNGASINNTCLWLVCVAVMWPYADARGLLFWVATQLIYQSFSIGCVVFRKRDPERDANAQHWANLSTVAMGLGGMAWAAGLAVTFSSQQALVLAFWGLVFSGIAAAVVAANPFYFPALFFYLVPMLGTHLYMHARAGTAINLGIAVVSLLYLLFCLAQGRHHLRLMIESLTIRLRNEELYTQLQQEKEAADAARAQAEEAARLKARFFAAASHDLRQPLHGLGLYADALQALPQLDPSARHLVSRVEAGVQSLASLFEGVMDMARLESSDFQPQMRWLAVSDFLDAVDSRFAPTAAQLGLAWRVSCAMSLEGAVVWGDEVALQRVVNNLVSNALRYTPDGAVMLCARLRAGKLCLELRDSGVGIASQEHASVFEPFYQVGNQARNRERGVGLGLATVQRLAHLLRLDLKIRSELGCGTCFSLHLHWQAQRPAQTDLPAALGATQLAQRALQGVRIVVLEDDAQVRDATVHLLRSWGMQVDAAAELSELSLAQAPQVVLSDWMLLQTDGLAAIAQLRERFGAIPALLVSGALSQSLENDARRQNVHTLAKPIKPAALRAQLTHTLTL